MSYVLLILSAFLVLTGIILSYVRPFECGPGTAIVTSLIFIGGGVISAYYMSWISLISTFIVAQLVYQIGLRMADKATVIFNSNGNKILFNNRVIYIKSIVFTMFDVMQDGNMDLLINFKNRLQSVTNNVSLSDDQIVNDNPAFIADTSDFFQFMTKYHSGILEFYEKNDEIVCIGFQIRAKQNLPEIQMSILTQIFELVKPRYGDPVEQIPNNDQPNIMKFEDTNTICVVTNGTVSIDGKEMYENVFRIYDRSKISEGKYTAEFLSK